MKQELEVLIEGYWDWLKDQMNLREIDDCVEITTPYLDRHNDFLQIYARRNDEGFVLTDDGYVVEDLELSGCKIESPRRRALFYTTLKGFGVETNNNALEVKVTPGNFAVRKHNLVQAMLAVNDLSYVAPSTVESLFHEDVAK